MTRSHEEGTMSQAVREAEHLELPAVGTYALDVSHTAVEFVARHMLTKVRGRFTEFSGQIEVAERPEDSSVSVEIKTDSIQTDTGKRDEHLKSGDFLLIEEYPTITFTSTAVRPTGGTAFELDGDLTIKDVTKPVTLVGEFLGTGPGMDGETPMLAATAKTTIQREDWGVNWNMAVETGGFLVSKSVDLEIEVEAHKIG
jgi:polyisoprenoid-binding protein YceI